MRLFDTVIGNVDRHGRNYMLKKREDGNYDVIPIDHSLAFMDADSDQQFFEPMYRDELILLDYDLATDEARWEEFVDIIGDLQEELRKIDPAFLVKKLKQSLDLLDSLFPNEELYKRKDRYDVVLERYIGPVEWRIDGLLQKTPEELALMLSPHRQRSRPEEKKEAEKRWKEVASKIKPPDGSFRKIEAKIKEVKEMPEQEAPEGAYNAPGQGGIPAIIFIGREIKEEAGDDESKFEKLLDEYTKRYNLSPWHVDSVKEDLGLPREYLGWPNNYRYANDPQPEEADKDLLGIRESTPSEERPGFGYTNSEILEILDEEDEYQVLSYDLLQNYLYSDFTNSERRWSKFQRKRQRKGADLDWTGNAYTEFYKDLPRKGIMQYVGSLAGVVAVSSETINNVLRGVEVPSERAKEAIKEIDDDFDNAPALSDFGAVLYRGLYGEFADQLFDSLEEGDFFTDDAYLSTSIDEQYARDWASLDPKDNESRLLLKIVVPGETRAIHTNSYFYEGDDEEAPLELPSNEVLIDRGATLKIISKYVESDGTRVFTAAITNQERKPIEEIIALEAKPKIADAPIPEKSFLRGIEGTESIIPVTIDPEEYVGLLDSKVKDLLSKYLPDVETPEYSLDELIDLMDAMGVLRDGNDFINSNDNIVDFVLKYLNNSPLSTRIAKLKEKIANGDDPTKIEAAVNEYDSFIARLNTEEGKEEIEKDVRRGFYDVLATVEDIMTEYPHMRGVLTVDLYHKNETRRAQAYATMNGNNIVTVYNPAFLSSMVGKLKMSKAARERHAGQVLGVNVEVQSERAQNSALTAMHEASHGLHFDAALSQFGVQTGKDAPPLAEQLMPQDAPDDENTMADTVFGSILASMFDWSPNVEYYDMSKKDIDFINRTGAAFIASIMSGVVDDGSLEGDLAGIIGSRDDKPVGFYEVLRAATGEFDMATVNNLKAIDKQVNTNGKAAQFVEDITGMSAESLINDLKASISDDIGVDIANIGTYGIPSEDALSALDGASTYARTETMEAFAEARTLLYLINSMSGVNLFGNEEKVKNMQEVVDKILTGIVPDIESRTMKPASARTRALYNKLRMLSLAINALSFGDDAFE